MYSLNDSVTNHTGFPHSEIAGYNGSYHLTGAYRRLARPSSPLTARASTVYAWSLNLTTRRCLVRHNRDCENLRDSDTPLICSCFGEQTGRVVSIFSLIQIFKEQISQT